MEFVLYQLIITIFILLFLTFIFFNFVIFLVNKKLFNKVKHFESNLYFQENKNVSFLLFHKTKINNKCDVDIHNTNFNNN
jgi:hypothetical protein